MKPGDIRSTPPKAYGECYMCRRLFDLEDLTPVDSQDSADWRYICPMCRDVATTRPTLKPGKKLQTAFYGIDTTRIHPSMLRTCHSCDKADD